MSIKIIITGATGMVGEGVLLHCLQNPEVSAILVLGRKSCQISHPKLSECIVPNFFDIENFKDKLTGYDACFYCAGVSSLGMNEIDYAKFTYDTSLHVANKMAEINPNMVFNFVSGAGTDSSENGKLMWARVKGKTENDLMKLKFKGQYNFRPGFMSPVNGQKNVKWFFYPFIWTFPYLLPSKSLTLNEVAKAMINAVTKGFERQILEIKDIKTLGKLR